MCVVGIGDNVDMDALQTYATFPDMVLLITNIAVIDSFMEDLRTKLCEVQELFRECFVIEKSLENDILLHNVGLP